MSTSSYIQLPPDGVGKKVRHELRTGLYLSSEGITTPEIGDMIYGATSGAYGELTGVVRDGTDIEYYLKNVTGTFTNTENVQNQNGSITYGTVETALNSVHTPVVILADPDAPHQQQKVDKRGAAQVSFPEGTPQFDSFGRMQVSQMQAVGEYSHVGEDLSGRYYTFTSGGGAVTHLVDSSSLRFSIGTAYGDRTSRTTNQYHPYKPGTSQLIYMTMAIGDAGKAGVVREWGYFDNQNGLGFRLNDTTLSVFMRSTTGGITTDTYVNQSAWSNNKLLSATADDFLLDITKGNIYWIDLEWLGMGRVRFGIIAPDGRRLTCHTFENANNNSYPYMRTGSLPLSWNQYVKSSGTAPTITGTTSGTITYAVANQPFLTGAVTPASASEMRLTCAAVFTETADLLYTGKLVHIAPHEPITIAADPKYKPFLNFKAKSTINGVPNTIVGIHETFDWTSEGNSSLHVGIFVLPNEKWLTGFNWSETIQPGTMLYVDQQATAMAHVQYWNSVKATDIAGNIANTTMTVTSIGSGVLLKEMEITPMPVYANGPLSGGFQSVTGTITDSTHVVKQLTATGSPNASPTYGTQVTGGVAGSNRLVLSSLTGVSVGHLISGNNLPQGTTIQGFSLTTNEVILSDYFTGTGSGTYNVYNPGGVGTYQVSESQTVASFDNYGAYYRVEPIESFIAPRNSNGRVNLGDRMEKSFGLGGNPLVEEDEKPVFVFGAKLIDSAATSAKLFYTKYWKEIR